MRVFLLISVLFVSGCSLIQASKTYQGVYNGGKDGIKADTKPVRQKLAKFIYSDEDLPAPPPVKSPVYCYKTLADVDCYKEPLEGEEDRLLE